MLIALPETIDPVLKKHPAARKPMHRWIEITEAAQWQSLAEVRRTFPHADAVRGTTMTCFNIGGNSFRLLTVISYERQTVVICELLTHAEYSKKHG